MSSPAPCATSTTSRSSSRPATSADPADRTRLIAALRVSERRLVGVCNNAGLRLVGTFAEPPARSRGGGGAPERRGLVELTGAFVKDMIEAGEGAILNVASTASFQPLPGMATYAATKAFVRSFSEAVHAELSAPACRSPSSARGFTETEFAEVAGAGSFEAKMPGFLVLDARTSPARPSTAWPPARAPSVPGVIHKAHALSSRFVPNTLLLPIARRITKTAWPSSRGRRHAVGPVDVDDHDRLSSSCQKSATLCSGSGPRPAAAAPRAPQRAHPPLDVVPSAQSRPCQHPRGQM